jgi:hypothetical protein
MDDFIYFRRMISPTIIGVGTLIGMVLVAIGGLAGVGVGLAHRSLAEVFTGFGTALLGPLLIRVIGESLILFFRMNETLSDIAQMLEQP